MDGFGDRHKAISKSNLLIPDTQSLYAAALGSASLLHGEVHDARRPVRSASGCVAYSVPRLRCAVRADARSYSGIGPGLRLLQDECTAHLPGDARRSHLL